MEFKTNYSLYESTTLLLSAKQNLFNKIFKDLSKEKFQLKPSRLHIFNEKIP